MANVRARRPASPPGIPLAQQQPQVHPHQPRFPHPRDDHLDADERRAAASKGLLAPGRYSGGGKYFPPGGLHLTSGEWKLLAVVVIVAAAVRLFRLSKPNSVVFDEVHFGKFAGKYIKTRYFVDVHPPLAKLLITLAAFVFGFNGDFDFKEIGKTYEHVPYVAMRMVPAVLGVATVPLSYLTLRALDCRATTALLASVFITFENGLVTQSRHILLDSPLVFFTALTIFFWAGFCNEDKHKPFTDSWWIFLVFSGLSLGAVSSSKWVGFFTVATIGCSTIVQLWNLLGDLRVTPKLFIKHFWARALCLIVIPIAFYMAMFEIHFLILENSGDGDGFMSSEFQHTLGGRGMQDTYADVVVGSVITMRHVNTQGGYLHSHPHNYPTGSQQQQITLYPHRDQNNEWRILNATDPSFDWSNEPLQYITPGMKVKLVHVSTAKHLHSHDHRPPISEVDFQNEVSAYGMPGFSGDANDDWFVEIYEGDKRDRESKKRLRTLRTKFRLRHALTGCYLFSHKVKLPDWGFEQQEVTCNKNAVKPNSLWFVETSATHPQLPEDAEKVNYKLPGFFKKWWELQEVMWTTNKGLTDRHTYDSRPESWPRLRRGINFWVKDHRQIYLLGNPFVWWLSTAAVACYAAIRGFLILRAKRGYRDFDNTKLVKYDSVAGFLFIGWVLHYAPFFLMGRQLFLHHYFPALYFAILLSCVFFDFLTSNLRARVRLQIGVVLMLIAIWHFQRFSSLAYGSPWTKKDCMSARWVKTWDFSCSEFLDEYNQYQGAAYATPTRAVLASTIGGEPGGRAAIVVEQNAQDVAVGAGNGAAGVVDPNANANENTHTLVPLHKAEPGVDIFADQAGGAGGGNGGDAGSTIIPNPDSNANNNNNNNANVEINKKINIGQTKEVEVEERKEVSSVHGIHGNGGNAKTEVEDKKKQDEKVVIQETTVVDSQGASEAPSSSSTPSEVEKPKKESQAGPQPQPESQSQTQAQVQSEGQSEGSASVEAKSEAEKPAGAGAGVVKPAGPLDESEAEAQKVAEELYPDAAAA